MRADTDAGLETNKLITTTSKPIDNLRALERMNLASKFIDNSTEANPDTRRQTCLEGNMMVLTGKEVHERLIKVYKELQAIEAANVGNVTDTDYVCITGRLTLIRAQAGGMWFNYEEIGRKLGYRD